MCSNSDVGDALNQAVKGGIEGLTVQYSPMCQCTEGTWGVGEEGRRKGGGVFSLGRIVIMDLIRLEWVRY